MKRLKKMIQWHTVSGNPVIVGDVTVTPQSQALIMRWPWGGLVWNRPASILVRQGEQTERVPIVDITRILQLGLLGLSLAFAMVTFVPRARERRNRNG